jgi:hypothetical protein
LLGFRSTTSEDDKAEEEEEQQEEECPRLLFFFLLLLLPARAALSRTLRAVAPDVPSARAPVLEAGRKISEESWERRKRKQGKKTLSLASTSLHRGGKGGKKKFGVEFCGLWELFYLHGFLEVTRSWEREKRKSFQKGPKVDEVEVDREKELSASVSLFRFV